MKQKVNLIGPLRQNFFVDFLVNQRRVSTQTLASYRDAFRLLLQFVRDAPIRSPSGYPSDQAIPALVVAIADEPDCSKSRALAASQALTSASIPSPACSR
jgi:integrase/recombinase XerD